jgi:copper(I)-binding protein
MLISLVEPLAVGDTVRVTLEFKGAGMVTIDVPVIDGIDGAMEGMSDDDDE